MHRTSKTALFCLEQIQIPRRNSVGTFQSVHFSTDVKSQHFHINILLRNSFTALIKKAFYKQDNHFPGCCSREKLGLKSRGRDPTTDQPVFQCKDYSSIVIPTRPSCHRSQHADEPHCVSVPRVRCRRMRQA